MASESTIIDLGVLDRDEPDGRPWSGAALRRRWAQWRDRWTRRWRRVPVRRYGQALLAALLCLAFATAAAPSAPRLAQVWTDPSLSLSGVAEAPRPVVDGQHLYAVTPTAAGPALTAYRLEDGSRAWQVRPDVAGEVTDLVVAAGVPVLATSGPRVTGYDPATGGVRWHRIGTPRRAVDGHLLVAARITGGQGERTVAVDPRTGEVSGAVVLPDRPVTAPWRAPDGTLHMFALTDDGTLTRHPMAGTATSATIRTQHRVGTGEPQASIRVVDGVVMLSDRTDAGPQLAAYDAASLRPRFTVPGGYGPMPCGPVVCVRVSATSEPYGSVWGVDPGSGAVRWSASCADADLGGGPCTLTVQELGRDRLWMEVIQADRYTHGSLATSWIAEARTGAPVTAPGQWSLQQRYHGSELLLRQSARDRAPGVPTRPSQVWWATADPAADSTADSAADSTADAMGGSEVDILGAVSATTCAPHHPYLVCWTENEGITVWRIGR